MSQSFNAFDDLESVGEALQSIAADGGKISPRILLRRLKSEISVLCDIAEELRAEQCCRGGPLIAEEREL